MTTSPPKVLVAGIGNPDRGDDAAGLLVARRVRGEAGLRAEVRELSADAAALMEAWKGAECAIVVDAMRSGLPPGTVRRIDARLRSVTGEGFRAASTHSFGVGEAIELGRTLGQLPPRLVVIGLEGERWGHGDPPSPALESAIEIAAGLVFREVASCTTSRS